MKAWKMYPLAAVILFVAFWVGYGVKAVIDSTNTAQASTNGQKPPTRAELLRLVNAERKKAGVKPLKEDPRLDASAQMKAQSEVDNNYFGHMLNGVFVGQKFAAATGIVCDPFSENITAANTAQLAITYWTESKPHYDAMVNPKYTLTGFGFAYVKYIPKSSEGPKVENPADITNSYVLTEHFCT